MLQTQKSISICHGMPHFEPNSDVSVRQDRTVFNHRAAVYVAIFFDAAEARNQRVFLNLRAAAHVCRRDNSRSSIDLGSSVYPNTRPNFTATRPHRAASRQCIRNEPAQILGMLQPVNVIANKVRSANFFSLRQQALKFTLVCLCAINNPQIQSPIPVHAARRYLPGFSMEVEEVQQIRFRIDVC